MKRFCLLLFLFSLLTSNSQNCEAFKYYGDTLKYKACMVAKERAGHYQFSKEYQIALDKALAIDSTYDHAYYAKSIAYLKSGDFITWKKLIDKAVLYNLKAHLGYRGWCRYQFFRDYKGAIQDIERLDSLVNYDIGMCQTGVYHLNIAKGLCYKALGQRDKAIAIIQQQLAINEKEDFVGAFDYLHLGVLYYETQQFQKATETFLKQFQINDIAENQYYLAMVYKSIGNLQGFNLSIQKAHELYLADRRMIDSYSNPLDRIYLIDIQKEL